MIYFICMQNTSTTALNRKYLESDSMSDMDKFSLLDGESNTGSRLLAKKKLLQKSSHNMTALEEWVALTYQTVTQL